MADDDTPKKKGKGKWLILIIFLLLLGGAGAGAWFFFLQDMFSSSGDEQAVKETKEATAPARADGINIPLPVFTTNLADPLGQRFIRMNIEVEVAGQAVADEMTKNNARIRDSIIILLSSKSYADIAGTESKLLLKSEITERLNNILGPGKVYQVFITDMVIQ